MLSRIRLLTQFRLAWQPIFFDVAMPTRPLPRSAVSLKSLAATRLPFLKIASNCGLESPLLSRNLVSTLQSASLQCVLTIGRSHSYSEPVRLAPVSIIWLVGPFHVFKSSLARLGSRLYLVVFRRSIGILPMGPMTFQVMAQSKSLGSANLPLIAVAAAVRGLTKCVRDPGPCRPS